VPSAVPPVEEAPDVHRKGDLIANAQKVPLEKAQVGRGEKDSWPCDRIHSAP
jgi:hypothetical protein